ncbi:hypothetical protein [Macrococcus capreoli]|uniref:hypothetical protein n=1 Tax=Macrococcus capreoli TaxID=2982690 RepID=UPI003EE674E9
MNIYCVFVKSLKSFEIFELEIKDQLDDIITFEFQSDLGTGQIRKEYLDSIHTLRNDRGQAIFTLDVDKIPIHVDTFYKIEVDNTKQSIKTLKTYNRHIDALKSRYPFQKV